MISLTFRIVVKEMVHTQVERVKRKDREREWKLRRE